MFDLCCRMQVPEVDLLLAIIQGVSPILGKGAVAQAVAPNVGPDAGEELGATQDDSMTASPRVLAPPEQSNDPGEDAPNDSGQQHQWKS